MDLKKYLFMPGSYDIVLGKNIYTIYVTSSSLIKVSYMKLTKMKM